MQSGGWLRSNAGPRSRNDPGRIVAEEGDMTDSLYKRLGGNDAMPLLSTICWPG